ncbi:S-adenosylmethionine:tRNA ribosyltransferase-isomerase [Thermoplasma sp.]|uniref:S-adenosylmethionine:tRNA ribosyltransferase-isomerase n=1 Tax=Thermoplasma sp. TaxID=1973142 RepID=UPI0012742184|nr:S-adenosylmethionine:tRNA ribosyltransferase-isomerase [Thermoplasma sp.]KAA8922158.1 MAG: hypothetical protein F6Q11_05680 [Thermoplasma sp.]
MNEIFSASFPRQMYGLRRSDSKMMIVQEGLIKNSSLYDLPQILKEGDLLIFNNSRIVPASIDVYSEDMQEYLTVNIGTDRFSDLFLLEVRPKGKGYYLKEESSLELLDGSGSIELFKRHSLFPRYWWGRLRGTDAKIEQILRRFGKFIRYDHIPFDIPEELYHGYFYRIPGSVEIPSASYSFDNEIIGELIQKGIEIRELTLHCNLGSLEPEEFLGVRRLMEERYCIPVQTLRSIFKARMRGNRVIAVGTTVVRALETVVENAVGLFTLRKIVESYEQGDVSGTTSLFIDERHSIKMVDGIITGMHEKEGSHIMMIRSFVDENTIDKISEYANLWGYQYHEFGDLELIFLNRK